jgi:hypothetical protein
MHFILSPYKRHYQASQSNITVSPPNPSLLPSYSNIGYISLPDLTNKPPHVYSTEYQLQLNDDIDVISFYFCLFLFSY